MYIGLGSAVTVFIILVVIILIVIVVRRRNKAQSYFTGKFTACNVRLFQYLLPFQTIP
jgi:hypothetical protein